MGSNSFTQILNSIEGATEDNMKHKPRKKKQTKYFTPAGWRVERWSKKKALQLLTAYQETDESTRVFYSPTTHDDDGGVIGEVRVEGDILYIEDCDSCYDHQKHPEEIKFSLKGKLKIQYMGGSNHMFEDGGDPTQLNIQNETTGEWIQVWDLGGADSGPIFIPQIAWKIADGKDVTKDIARAKKAVARATEKEVA
jgi:hypothetical protein